MNRNILAMSALTVLLAVGAAWGQAPGPAGAGPRGFSSPMLIAQLSLYLPEEATRDVERGFGGRAGGQAGQGQTGQAGAFPRLQFTRDPKLFLTKEQIAALLPILTALRANPMPTPSGARKVQADVDAVLTAAQKAEWEDFQRKIEALIEQFRQRMGTNGASGGPRELTGPDGTGDGAPRMTQVQRRQRQLDSFIKVLQDSVRQGGP